MRARSSARARGPNRGIVAEDLHGLLRDTVTGMNLGGAPAEVELWFDDVLVGSVSDAYRSDGTSFGRVTLHLRRKDALQARLLEFVVLSIDWNRRVAEDPTDPPDSDEFLPYREIVQTGRWTIRSGAEVSRIVDAPLFFAESEVSWITST